MRDIPYENPVPDWLATTADDPAPPQSKATRELLVAQYEIAFERILERIANGYTLRKAILEDLREIDIGAFQRWMKREPERMRRYDEAKEIRTEVWASRVIEIAEAEDNPLEDVQRSKLKIDTYKWLMGSDNRRRYGDIKQVEVNQNISITAALEQARARLSAPREMLEDVSDAEFTQIEGDE